MADEITTTKRLDWLDALRGWAVLGVVLVHTGQSVHLESGILARLASSGRFGVQLFFIVSALTISITYNSHITKYGSSLRTAFSWFIKRFFRIAPLYYFAILFYAVGRYAIYIGSHHKYGGLPNTVPDIMANVAFVHTWVPSANNVVVPGGWSIGVEVFFYLLVPLIWAVPKERTRALYLGFAIVPAILLSILVSILTTRSAFIGNDDFLYYWFPTQYPVLALGLIYYLFAIKPKRRLAETTPATGSIQSWLFFVAFAVVFLFGVVCGTKVLAASVLSPLFVGVAFICLIMSLQGAIKKALVNSVLTFLGRISYSIYIFHFVVLYAYRALAFRGSGGNSHSPYWLLVVFPAVVILTSGIAYLSKRFLEDPGIRLGHVLSNRVATANLNISLSNCQP